MWGEMSSREIGELGNKLRDPQKCCNQHYFAHDDAEAQVQVLREMADTIEQRRAQKLAELRATPQPAPTGSGYFS